MNPSREDIRAYAANIMNQKKNCAQTSALALAYGMGIELSQDMVDALQFSGHGMESGCVCGALSGAVLVSGLIHARTPHPLGNKLPKHLHDLFKETFGATCCRVIHARRPEHLQKSRVPCIELTALFAEKVYLEWQNLEEKALQQKNPSEQNV